MDKQAKRILIVEDEMIIALMIERMVQNLGHNVLKKVTSGEAAVAAAKEVNPDLILMDIRLNGEMDGIDAMTEIRKSADVPVIYISGNSDPVHKKRVDETGCLDFLIKPVSINKLSSSFDFAS